MSFATTISALSSKVDGLIANRVAKFAYTQQAYNSDDVNGVENYDYAEEQNIPLGTTSVLKVNETILTKGWRTQASAITRMLMNHFLGRTSYNLNKTVDFLKGLMTAITDNMGVAEGFATLDANGRIPSGQLTEEVMEYKGEWNADTNNPELDEETGKKGDVYKVSVSGTQDLGEGEKYFRVGTYIIFDGTAYTVLSGEDVAKVNNIAPDTVGNVTLTGEDIEVSSTDTLSITSKITQILKTSFVWLLGRYWKLTSYSFNGNNVFLYTNKNLIHASSASLGIMYSYDGTTWSQTNITSGSYAIAHFKKVFIAFPTSSNDVLYSYDGITWQSSNLTNAYCSVTTSHYALPIINGVKATNNILIFKNIATNNKDVWSTTDGINWETTLESTSNVGTVWLEGGKFFVYDSNALMMSDDGVTWTTSNTDVNNITKLIFAKGLWVAVNSAYKLIYSTDATTWLTSSLSSVTDVAFGNDTWLAIVTNKAMYSNDVTTWTNSNITTQAKSFFASNGVLFLLKSNNTIFMTSVDGKTWVNANINVVSAGSAKPIFYNGVWLYLNYEAVFYSLNGYDWLKSSLVTQSRKEIGLLPDRFVIVSNETDVYISSIDTLIENGWLKLD